MYAVEIKDVWKNFRIYHEKHDTLKETILKRGRTSFEEFWGLQGINMAINNGQTIGIIGENGSGKSTLLKCIAKIIEPTRGEIMVNGKVSALLELGAGFEPNLTGRENIYLNGSILQLTKKQIDESFDDIVKFAELERFIDTPVKNYSSGMQIRLGFAVAVNVDPEVLLIDEILAVGDEAFQAKCFDKILEIKNRGKTIILVTHDLVAVRKVCDSAAWLDSGRLMKEGSTAEVIDAYLGSVHKKEKEQLVDDIQEILPQGNRYGSGEVRIAELKIRDGNGVPTKMFDLGAPIKVSMRYESGKDLGDLVFGVSIFAKDGTYCFGTNSRVDDIVIPQSKGGGTVTLAFNAVSLMAGTYLLDVAIFDPTCSHTYDYLSRSYDFKIRGGRKGENGFYHIDHEWEIG